MRAKAGLPPTEPSLPDRPPWHVPRSAESLARSVNVAQRSHLLLSGSRRQGCPCGWRGRRRVSVPVADPLLEGVRRQLWTKIRDLVGWDGAAVLAATQVLLQLEHPIRHGRHDVVAGVVKRGHFALDELDVLR